MGSIDDSEYQEILTEINDEKKLFKDNNLYYCPNSIWHGSLYIHGRFKKETLLTAKIEDTNDFLHFLFEESEHCDHITHAKAYEQYEVNEKLKERLTLTQPTTTQSLRL